MFALNKKNIKKMYRKSIFKALVALMFIMLGANFNANAQSGSLAKKLASGIPPRSNLQ